MTSRPAYLAGTNSFAKQSAIPSQMEVFKPSKLQVLGIAKHLSSKASCPPILSKDFSAEFPHADYRD